MTATAATSAAMRAAVCEHVRDVVTHERHAAIPSGHDRAAIDLDPVTRVCA